jgi:hypothetical protein
MCLPRFGRRYIQPKWREEAARRRVYSEGERSAMSEYLPADLDGRGSVTAVRHLKFPEGSV